jgi:hypothetical protein
MSLKNDIALSYREHPEFRRDGNALTADLKSVDEFAVGYALLRDHGRSLARSRRAQLTGRCSKALDTVLAGLQRQAEDAFELAFLTELKSHCARLMAEELGYAEATVRAAPRLPEGPLAEAGALALWQRRHFFGVLPAAAVDEIRLLAEGDVDRFRLRARNGELRREDLSVNDGPVVTQITAILNREFAAQGVLSAVSTYMNADMRVSGAAVELSVPQATWWANTYPSLQRPPHPMYAHLDESLVFPKSIVYLTDVAPENGPTRCFPGVFGQLELNPLQELIGRALANVGNERTSVLHDYYRKRYHQSMASAAFRRHFMRLPEVLRFNSHLGWDICPGSEAERSIMSAEAVMLGARGTYIVFDGARLLHSGGMVERGERLALQVVFAAVPRRVRIRQLLVRRRERPAKFAP